MTVVITWLPINAFIIVILDMDSAPHVGYSDVVPCGAFAVINNYPMDGLATISNSMSLLRILNYKQTHQTMPYLEWIPFDCIDVGKYGLSLYSLPTYELVRLIPLEITDETHDLYYAEVNHLLMRHVY